MSIIRPVVHIVGCQKRRFMIVVVMWLLMPFSNFNCNGLGYVVVAVVRTSLELSGHALGLRNVNR